MKIHLNQAEIFEAVEQYIGNQGISLLGRNIEIEMKAGRGERGHYADVHIRRENESADPFEEDAPEAFEPSPDDNAIDFD